MAFDGVDDGEIDARGMSAESGAITEDDFAKDDGMVEGLFGMVIGLGYF